MDSVDKMINKGSELSLETNDREASAEAGQWPRHVVARWARRAGERRRAAAVIDFPRFPPTPSLPPSPPRLTHFQRPITRLTGDVSVS